MSSIVKMYDASNNDVYPITHLRAVRDSNGTTLESMIQGVNETTVGYYECTTAGSTPEKTITIDSSVSLSVRISCKVKFAEKNTGANATMNINNTGAKPLFYNGVRAAANNSWYPNEIVDLYFDGTNYQAKSCADTLEYDVSLHQTHEITEVTTTTRTVVYNGDVTSGWENETSVSDSSVNGYTRTETNTGKDNDTTTVDGPTAKYDTASNKTSVVYVTKRTLTHVVNDYTFDEAVNAVPMSYRHGGLKLRFISNSDGSLQSSDNKYLQYRLMANEWSTTVSDWQGVDDEPTTGSNNLVKSGGVADSINKLKNAGYLYAGIATPTTNPGTPEVPVFYIANGKGTYTNFSGIEVTEDEAVILYYDTVWHKEATGIASNDKLTELDKAVGDFSQKNTEEEGFYICDAEGNVLIRLDVLDTKGGIGESLANSIRSIIQGVGATGFDNLEAQEIGTELSKIINGFKDVKDVAEDGFYICNEDGDAVAKFVDDKWEFLGLADGKTIPRKGAETEKYARASAGTYILENFPNYLKMGRTVTLSADVEQFDTIEIGVINTEKRTITIDSTNITLATDGTSRKTEAHGLTISGQLRVTFVADMFEVKAIIDCNGEQYIFKHTSNSYVYANHLDCSAYGNVGMIVGGSTILNNVILSASSNYFDKDIWILGDSYTSIDSSARWPNHVLFDFEYKNFMICGLSGGSSAQLYADLEKCLQYGTPKEIIWLLGMNNGDLADAPNPSWLENLEKVEKICEDKDIELVLGTIPCTNQQTNDNSFKNEVIKSRGHRYINFAKAVGAEIKGSSWYIGMKEPDHGIHPSELGAKVLAAQILADCPELTK